MTHAENYENVFKFVKVIYRILWTLFSGHGIFPSSILLVQLLLILLILLLLVHLAYHI